MPFTSVILSVVEESAVILYMATSLNQVLHCVQNDCPDNSVLFSDSVIA